MREQTESESVDSFIHHPSRSALIGSLFVLIAAFGFSAKAIFIKLAYASAPIDAINLMGLRMAMAFPFFLVAAICHRKEDGESRLQQSDWLAVLGLGTIGYYLASYLDFVGLTYISAGLERLILFLYPTLVVLFSALLSRKFISLAEFLALILSYAGIALVVGAQLDGHSDGLWLGAALVFASAITFAMFMMGSGVMIRRMGSIRFTCYSMMVSCIATGIHLVLHSSSQLLGLPAQIYGLAFLMAVLSTVIPAFFMNAGIRRLGSGPASIISSIGPVATLILAYFLLDERLGFIQCVGTALVIAGVCVITRNSASRQS